MIHIPFPDFYNLKEIEIYFIKLIIYSSTPHEAFKEFCYSSTQHEAFKEFCKHKSAADIRKIAQAVINSEYVQIKRRYGSSLVKELL